MSALKSSFRAAGGMLLLALLLPLLNIPAAAADPGEDLDRLLEIETAARQKSLALLAVIRSMGPEFSEQEEVVTMARIVSVTCEIREARSLESRVILQPNLNDEFLILDEDDNNVRLDLGDGRTGWIDESHIQRIEKRVPGSKVDFEGAAADELRRYAEVIDELLLGIDEDREQADELLARLLPADGSPALTDRQEQLRARGAHARVAEYHAYAHRFYDKYIAGYDFTIQNGNEFLENLTAWGNLLLGTSKFTTTTMISATDDQEVEVDETVREIELGGEVDVNERASVRAGFANKAQVNQTAYTTTTADAGYAMRWSDRTDVDLAIDTYKFADDLNSFNDFRRTRYQASARSDRGGGNRMDLRYGYTKQSFDENDTENFQGHSIDAAGLWKRGGGRSLRARMLANFESSDVAFHDFKHLTPSLELSRRSGADRSTWRAVYEMLDYAEADLRSFGRAQLEHSKSSQDGPRRATRRLSATWKKFPDNELATYAQIKGAWTRSRGGPSQARNSLITYTNFYPDNSDNNYTDVRVARNTGSDRRFLELNLYTRIWHSPGDDDSTSTNLPKPYVGDVYAHFGWKKGNVRFGPTLGAHVVLSKGNTDIDQDGNLLRAGFRVAGDLELPNRFRATLDAAYDYGFVYTQTIDSIDSGTGALVVGDVEQRHPTTLQANFFVSRPLGNDFDFTGRFTMYRIATDMDMTTSITPVTHNDRFTLFAGVRYRHN